MDSEATHSKEVNRMNEVPVLRSSVGKTSLMIIYKKHKSIKIKINAQSMKLLPLNKFQCFKLVSFVLIMK